MKKEIKEMEHIEAQEHFSDCPKCQKIFCQKLEAREKEMLEKIMKAANVEVKDMPAFPPARMSCIDVICLAVKIGITKRDKEILERKFKCPRCGKTSIMHEQYH